MSRVVYVYSVVAVFTLNRSMYPATSAVPPVSFLILHPRDTNYVVTDSQTEKPNAKESREANQVLAYRVREHNKKNATREIRATKKK